MGEKCPVLKEMGHGWSSEVGLCPDLGPFVNEVGYGGSRDQNEVGLPLLHNPLLSIWVTLRFPSRLPW